MLVQGHTCAAFTVPLLHMVPLLGEGKAPLSPAQRNLLNPCPEVPKPNIYLGAFVAPNAMWNAISLTFLPLPPSLPPSLPQTQVHEEMVHCEEIAQPFPEQ